MSSAGKALGLFLAIALFSPLPVISWLAWYLFFVALVLCGMNGLKEEDEPILKVPDFTDSDFHDGGVTAVTSLEMHTT